MVDVLLGPFKVTESAKIYTAMNETRIPLDVGFFFIAPEVSALVLVLVLGRVVEAFLLLVVDFWSFKPRKSNHVSKDEFTRGG